MESELLLRVCIIGCGAVGSLFAAHLAQKGEAEVWAYDVWKDHVEAIRKNGLRISGAADFTAKLNATSDPDELPRCDYGIVATKAIHTRSAIAQVARAFDENSAVCSVQNGVGNEEIIAEHVKYVIRGTTFPAGHPIAPGHVGLRYQGRHVDWSFRADEYSDVEGRRTGGTDYAFRHECDRAARRPRRAVDEADFQRCHESGRSADAAASRRRNAISRRPAQLFNDLIAEGEAVAKALGIELHGDPRALVQKGANAPGKHRASMLQDVLAKRQTEVDFMNGAIVKWGEKTGVPTPLNKAIWELIKGLEHAWSDPD